MEPRRHIDSDFIVQTVENTRDLRHLEEEVTEMKGDLKAILRNQWLTAGALAVIMMLMNYPQLIHAITPAEAHEVR